MEEAFCVEEEKSTIEKIDEIWFILNQLQVASYSPPDEDYPDNILD